MRETNWGKKAYWDEQKKEEEIYKKEMKEFNNSPEGQQRKIERKIASLETLRTDSGLTKDQAEELKRAEEDLAAAKTQARLLKKQAEEGKKTEWTIEVTKKRRQEWNGRVKSGEFNLAHKPKISWDKVREGEEKQGWTHEELKAAIKRHDL